MSRFLLNFWGQTYRPGGIGSEAELRAYATSIANDRKVIVGYYEVRDGKAVLLGAVSGREASVERAEPAKAPKLHVERERPSERLSLVD